MMFAFLMGELVHVHNTSFEFVASKIGQESKRGMKDGAELAFRSGPGIVLHSSIHLLMGRTQAHRLSPISRQAKQ